MTLTPTDLTALNDLLKSQEDWMMGRLLVYAERQDYTKYTSTLKEAWRLSLAGLTVAITENATKSGKIPELRPDEDYTDDPVSRFGVVQAQKHRARGVSLSMFLGLMKYYRQCFVDLIAAQGSFEDPDSVFLYLHRCFDRIEIGFCTEWSGAPHEFQIRDLAEANRLMANEKNMYLTLFESLSSPVILTDTDGYIVNLNHAAAVLFSDNPGSGAYYYDPEKTRQRPHWIEDEIKAVNDGGCARTFEKTWQRYDDERVFTVSIERMLDVSQKYAGLTILFNDVTEKKRSNQLLRQARDDLEEKVKDRTAELQREITERKKVQKRIYDQATHDPLTNLPNRTLFADRLGKALTAAERRGNLVALLFIDLDRFKTINDTLGHGIGDDLLKQAALRLEDCVRRADSVARLGGDEFTVILEDIRSSQDAANIAEKIIRTLTKPYRLGTYSAYSSASIGITVFPVDTADAEEMLRNADMAMYEAKEQGRKRYHFFTPEMNAAARSRLELENDLHRAVENREFEVNYQPIVDIRNGEAIGAEALLRWNHPRKGQVLPEVFIPQAEETGLIDPLGKWVLRAACRQAAGWCAAEHPGFNITVNVSACQVLHGGFSPQDIGEILEQAGLPPDQLTLEITENLIIEDSPESMDWLTGLKNMGVHLSIDDFGTGFSSLSYLKKFPIDRLKIDRSFIHGITDDSGDASLVEAILAMAKSLDLMVIAEGVETAEQARFLRRRGCHFAQGFHYCRTVPADELARYLSHGNTAAMSSVAAS